MNREFRLQNPEFQNYRHLLKMKGYEISEKGNIKAIMISTLDHKIYTHWLNNEEKLKFVLSNYFKIYNPLKGRKEDLYKSVISESILKIRSIGKEIIRKTEKYMEIK